MTQAPDLSIWSHKPWWCQPWSILLTGVAVAISSWLLFGRWWLSLLVAVGVLLWWGLFLVLVPAAWRQEAQAAQVEGGVSQPVTGDRHLGSAGRQSGAGVD